MDRTKSKSFTNVKHSHDIPTATLTDSQDLCQAFGQHKEENIVPPKIAIVLKTAGKFDELEIDVFASSAGPILSGSKGGYLSHGLETSAVFQLLKDKGGVISISTKIKIDEGRIHPAEGFTTPLKAERGMRS